MEAVVKLRVIKAERVGGDVVIEFDSGECALYSALNLGSGPGCQGNFVTGNVQIINNNAAVIAISNSVAGNLVDQNNSAPTQVVGNTVTCNLQVRNNTGVTQVSNNSVNHNLICHNNSSIGGGGNTAASKQGAML